MNNIINSITNCKSENDLDFQNNQDSSNQVTKIMISPIKNNSNWLKMQNKNTNGELPDVNA